jgi:peptidoglycan/LPS O-acetylase OafA/YrhL
MLREEKRTGAVSLSQFYIRRAFRILPPALMFMAVIFIWSGPSMPLRDKASSLLFMVNYMPHPDVRIGHLWSLGVEEQFYLLWPFLFITWPAARKHLILLTMVAVPIINVLMTRFGWPFCGTAFYSVADTIACGCLLALMQQHRTLGKILDGRFFPLVPVLTFFAMLGSFMNGGIVFGTCKFLLMRPALNIGIALIIEKAARTAPRFLNTRPIVLLGMMSYSIYIWQQPIAFSHRTLTPYPLLDVLLHLLLIGVLASASYLLLEKRSHEIRHRVLATAGS